MSLLPETARRVDAFAARAQAEGRAPSLVLAVVRDRTILHLAGVGEHPVPDADTQYRLGSITKTLTATLVMQLRNDGHLGLDDPLDRHLPGTSLGGVTVRQLLGHISGLQREPDGPWWERHPGGDVGQLLAGLGKHKLAGGPNRRFHYSNLAYGLLGAVVAAVTGEPWRTMIGTRLLDPLGMTRTTYAPREPYARGYVVHALDGSRHEEPRHDAGAMAPAGQLWSTATDLATWAAQLADPAPVVLPRETVDEMCTPVAISDLASWTTAYGLGVRLYRVGERVFVGHDGSMPGYVAQLLVHRGSRLGVLAFANSYDLAGTPLRQVALATLTEVIDAEPSMPTPWPPGAPPVPTPWPPGAHLCREQGALIGKWWWMGREFEMRSAGEALELSGPRQRSRFVREAPDRWRGVAGEEDGEVMHVRRDPDGAPAQLDIATFVYSRDPAHLA